MSIHSLSDRGIGHHDSGLSVGRKGWTCRDGGRSARTAKLTVPVHSEVRANEEADELTRRGAVMDLVWIQPAVRLPLQYITKKVADQVHREYDRRWRLMHDLRQSRVLVSGPDRCSGRYMSRAGGTGQLESGAVDRHGTRLFLGRNTHAPSTADSIKVIESKK